MQNDIPEGRQHIDSTLRHHKQSLSTCYHAPHIAAQPPIWFPSPASLPTASKVYATHQDINLASMICRTSNLILFPVELGLMHDVESMTVLLKNLFTVHFQFDLLKLETNNTCDDKVNHAWIIARWTAGWGDSLFDHCGDELGWIFIQFDPRACNLNRPPIPTTHPLPPPQTPNQPPIAPKFGGGLVPVRAEAFMQGLRHEKLRQARSEYRCC